MRYIVIGAGAIGGSIGARLFETGGDVVLVARGAHYEALRDRGLRFGSPDGLRTLPIPVVDSPDELVLHPDDVFVLAVKSQDTVAALGEWAGCPVSGGGRAEELPLICAQNGVANERIALRRFANVLGMCVWLPSTHLEPGSVVAPCAPLTGILHIGRYPSGIDDVAQQVSADLEKSVFLAPVVPDVMRWKYAKLLMNLGNAVEAVCGRIDESGMDLLNRLVKEGRAVLDAAGIAYTSDEEQAEMRSGRMEMRPVEGVPERAGGSSWQSMTRGAGRIEADYLNGEIVLLGREFGVPTPANVVVQRVANDFARNGRRPGDITMDELASLIDR